VNFDEVKFRTTLQKLNEMNPSDNIMETLEMIKTSPCPTSGGKKRKFRGGFKFTKEQLTSFIYVIIAALVALAFTGRNSVTVYNGLEMMIKGECGYLSNKLWAWGGFENPICTFYNKKMYAIMQALLGNTDAIGELTKLVAIVGGTPILITAGVKKITDIVYPLIQSEEAPVPVITTAGRRSKTFKRSTRKRTRRNTRKRKNTRKRR
jgi:hypothetical protein